MTRSRSALTAKARSVMNREQRAEIYRVITKLVLEDAPCAFLAHRRSFVAHRSDLEGVTLHLLSPSVTPKDLWFANGGDKAQAAAEEAVPDATAQRIETDAEGAAYEVHMTRSDGSIVTVKLDSNFAVTATETDEGRGGCGGGHGGRGGRGPLPTEGTETAPPAASSEADATT